MVKKYLLLLLLVPQLQFCMGGSSSVSNLKQYSTQGGRVCRAVVQAGVETVKECTLGLFLSGNQFRENRQRDTTPTKRTKNKEKGDYSYSREGVSDDGLERNTNLTFTHLVENNKVLRAESDKRLKKTKKKLKAQISAQGEQIASLQELTKQAKGGPLTEIQVRELITAALKARGLIGTFQQVQSLLTRSASQATINTGYDTRFEAVEEKVKQNSNLAGSFKTLSETLKSLTPVREGLEEHGKELQTLSGLLEEISKESKQQQETIEGLKSQIAELIKERASSSTAPSTSGSAAKQSEEEKEGATSLEIKGSTAEQGPEGPQAEAGTKLSDSAE